MSVTLSQFCSLKTPQSDIIPELRNHAQLYVIVSKYIPVFGGISDPLYKAQHDYRGRKTKKAWSKYTETTSPAIPAQVTASVTGLTLQLGLI